MLSDCSRLVCIVLSLLLLLVNGCASLPSDYERAPSFTITDTQDTPLARKVGPAVAAHPGQSGFYSLANGMDAFVARVGLIDQAQRSLDIQYYIWHGDTTGTLLVDRVLRAADRGVRVRMLLDDLDTAGKDRSIALIDAHPNIEIRLYNPFANRSARAVDFAADLKRVNRRMHNKSLTADNHATIVGGRNIGNEYFGAVSHAEFADLDVLALGPVVNDVSNMFDKYWNSDWAFPVKAFHKGKTIGGAVLAQAREEFSKVVEELKASPYVEALRQSGVIQRARYSEMQFYWGKALLIYDDPGKVEATEVDADTHLAPKLSPYVQKTKEELIIISPYFVPGDALVDGLGEMVQRGIRVRILTNSLAANDVGVVHAGYMRYRTALLKKGVELYEFKAIQQSEGAQHEKKWSGSSQASLHAKTFALDRHAVFVGSFNLDPRSVALNTEMGVLFESPELAGALGKAFDSTIANTSYRLELKALPADEYGSPQYALEWVAMENGKEVRYQKEPDTSWWQRIMTGFLSIIVIESFL
ncbi:phospholipase D family protein [Kaarinaea lacus]